MALKNDFYNEIFEKEEKWAELVNKNLLTSIYCKFELRPFYIQKRLELEQELEKINNDKIQEDIISSMYTISGNIINKIDTFIEKYENCEFVDFNTLLPLLFINKMKNNNNTYSKDGSELLNQQKTEIKKAELERLRKNVIKYLTKKDKDLDNDYVFDDFYEEENKKIA